MSSAEPAATPLLGVRLASVDAWSERVAVALGMNPGIFTGPGTNTYLVGRGRHRILLDTGQGRPEYLPVLERALERAGCEGIQEIVLTHGHPDHTGGLADVLRRFGSLRVSKLVVPEDAGLAPALAPLRDGDVVETEGARLRALFTPGHAPDHLCFLLEEENALFSGDNVLGVGTTVIPEDGGDLADYLASLERLLALAPGRIYPAHGPCIEDGPAKLREYLAHRRLREEQILAGLVAGPTRVPELVERIYTDVPRVLHPAAAHSVAAHLRKLERERRVRRDDPAASPLAARWRLS